MLPGKIRVQRGATHPDQSSDTPRCLKSARETEPLSSISPAIFSILIFQDVNRTGADAPAITAGT
jgi:hypothetical protein